MAISLVAALMPKSVPTRMMDAQSISKRAIELGLFHLPPKTGIPAKPPRNKRLAREQALASAHHLAVAEAGGKPQDPLNTASGGVTV